MGHIKAILAILLLLSATTIAKGQSAGTGTIKGKIVDKLTRRPVPGASVTIESTQNGTIADSAGIFILREIRPGIYMLEVSFVGYQDKPVTDVQIAAGKTNYIEIEIEESLNTLSAVQVNARKHENNSLTPVSAYTFSREEIATNPGSAGDIFRALSMMPGVSANGAEYSAIAVRGQGTTDNVYFVDNIPVTNISHLDENVMGGFDDPNGGRYSIFAPRVINQAEFIGGGFPAQYGRRSASYLGLQIKEGNREDFTVDGQLDLLGVTVGYDGPSYLAKNTSLFISARYQNFGPLVDLVNQKDGGLPILGDYIFKSVSELGSKNKLAVTMIYSPETYTHTLPDVKQDTAMNNPLLLDFSSNKQIIGATLQTFIGKNSYWKNVLYFTRTKNDDEYGNVYPTIDQNTGKIANLDNLPFDNDVQHIVYSEQSLGFRSIFTQKFHNNAQLVAGFDLFMLSLNNRRVLSRPDTSYTFGIDYPAQPGPGQYYSIFSPQDFNASFDRSKLNASAYLDYSVLLFKLLTVNAGLRYDYSGFSNEQNVSPRVSGTFNVDRNNSINFAVGLYYQDPQYSDIAAQPQGNLLKLEQIREYIIGYRRYFTPDLKLTVEGWYKDFSHLIVQPVNGSVQENNNGTGWAKGADIYLVQRLSHRFHGQIGYSYMVSKRDDKDGLGQYNFGFSEPNQANFLLAYSDNTRWVLSAKFRYATGRPADSYIIHANIFNDQQFIRYSEQLVGKNDYRLPAYVQLDVRADYRFKVKRSGFTAFIDIADINNRLNANAALFNFIKGRVYRDGLRIFPTFGVRFSH
jgi:hypothetical protein